VPATSSLGAGLGSAASTVGGGGDHMLALVAALGATTLGVLAAAVVRGRQRRS
jgi:hypothetical protein